jgi:hypothetical protein
MQFEGAKVTEQGVTFGIVVVKPHVLSSTSDRAGARSLGTRAFGRVPIVLMAQNSRGVPTYQGRRDIVGFLSRIAFQRIPWKKYTL